MIETLAGEAAAGARLGELVGMSFGAFTSAVLLAQGRFAEFLTAQPRERDAILRELFGVASLEGARQAAVALERVATAEAQLRMGDAAGLPGHAPSERAGAARAARAAAGVHAAARRLLGPAEDVRRERAAAEAARTRRDSARAGAAELPDAAGARTLTAELVAAREAAAEADARHTAASARRGERDAARDAVRMRHGGGSAELAALRERAVRVRRLASELPERERALDARERTLAAERAALAASRRDADAAAAEAGRREASDALLGRWHERAAEARRAAAAQEEARTALAQAAARRAAAEEAQAAAEAAEERARRHDLAATLQHGLEPGDPCPVCGAAVGEHLPDAPGVEEGLRGREEAREAAAAAGRAWAGAEERARSAARDADEARKALAREAAALESAGIAPTASAPDPAEARTRAEAMEAVLAQLRDRERALDAEAASCAAERAGLARDAAERDRDRDGLGSWASHEEPVAALDAALAEVAAAERTAEDARADATSAAEAAARAHAAMARLESGPLAQLRAAAARVAARGSLPAPDGGLAGEELIAAAGELRDAALAAAAAHAARAARAQEAAGRAQEALAADGAALGVADPDDLGAALRGTERARDAARARWAAVEEAAARARRLRAQAEEAERRARVHRQVANDLRANAFPRFLLARYRERLAVGASARLHELTAGAYRFAGTEPDPLAVIDQRRGERRRGAATLSGGERFLASLALALGLSDVAAESGGRLDCLFLDEGFSSLDAESLEQALAGVERLAGDGRLVAVITHLPGVADRLGAAIHVDKDPEGVSRIAAS